MRHVERNDGTVPLTFVQMWLAPREPGGEPSYAHVPGPAGTASHAVPAAEPSCTCGARPPGERTPLPDGDFLYVHVVRGRAELDGRGLGPGDAARITGARGLELTATEPAEILAWAMGSPA